MGSSDPPFEVYFVVMFQFHFRSLNVTATTKSKRLHSGTIIGQR